MPCGIHGQTQTQQHQGGQVGQIVDGGPGEEIKGQEGVLVPREEVQGPLKVSKGNSNAWEKRR